MLQRKIATGLGLMMHHSMAMAECTAPGILTRETQCGNTLYTAGNLNNDIGVPMTLLRLTPEYDYAVIELGANHQGENCG